MKSLNGNFQKELIESKIKKKIKFTKNSDKIKNVGEFTIKHAHETHINAKCHFLSSKMEKASKYKINITNTPTNHKFNKSKFSFLSGKKTQKELTIKEKKEIIQSFFNNKERKEKHKIVNLKEKKSKIYNKCLHYSKKEQILDLLNFDEFNKKLAKNSGESPTKTCFNNQIKNRNISFIITYKYNK